MVDIWSLTIDPTFSFRSLKGRCHENQFYGQNRWNHLWPWHSEMEWNIAIPISMDSLSFDGLATSCKNLVYFGPVNPEFKRLEGVHPSSISSLATFTARCCGDQYWVLWVNQYSVLFQLFVRGQVYTRFCHAFLVFGRPCCRSPFWHTVSSVCLYVCRLSVVSLSSVVCDVLYCVETVRLS